MCARKLYLRFLTVCVLCVLAGPTGAHAALLALYVTFLPGAFVDIREVRVCEAAEAMAGVHALAFGATVVYVVGVS